ncbi:MAG: cupin domain-containing protein [Mixta calida]|uniref:ribosomal protein uL16 3-hydroxylase n=2 Tax=Erwiniaceae TaxID=1903409 RepID=UPI000535C5F4|nr:MULTISPECIES: cupin domain-containing protein [Mixta]AIX74091.1 50S ribosomal protein L16 arginine hydroxylase [Pantoea sp. PSNIH2]MBS6059086.1 cupin domain-containing protein [Pantoea sp.]POU51487.1 cupin domain-containing protein [Pantoea sp. PSNIH5]POU62940.1 cupin domain-containing protein [Pantoea sp. PSNIH4]POY69548.1 cupin domain-containing protein [Pantoea sp. PSNIH3]HCW48278.1 cupin domain-containing protein [Erwiniaceae bacterium]
MDYQLDLNWTDFLHNYWQKRPVILKRGFKNFIDPISPDELAGLAMESEVDSRLVSQQDGKWQVSHGPFESYDHLGEHNWSLLVQAVNHWHEPCAALMRPFRFLPDWRIDDLMISFSVPGGGVGPHLDQYDVFIIQGTGRRRWRVGDKTPLKQHCPHPDLLQVEPFDAIIDEEMEPGDILYIPPGFPHEGYSLENALNYSVGFRAPSGRELISGFADFVLARELGGRRYSDPDIAARDCPSEILPQEIAGIRDLMLEVIDQPEQFRQWFGEFISQSRHELDIAPPEPPYQPDEIYDALQQGDRLTRLGGLRVLKIGDAVFINGEQLESAHPAALSALADKQTLNLNDFAEALDDPAFLAQLAGLVNSGYWFFNEA